MTTYLIHAGTGTIINADDDVYIITVAEGYEPVSDDDDDALVALALYKGTRFQLNDLTWSNCVAYSPSSIREEIRESLSEYYGDEEWLSWAENATDDELNAVARYILSADDVWQNFSTNLVEGLREGYRWSKEAK